MKHSSGQTLRSAPRWTRSATHGSRQRLATTPRRSRGGSSSAGSRGATSTRPAEGTAAENFSVAIPPPNVTSALHMGHALNGTIQDALVRLNRMRGRNSALGAGYRPRQHRRPRLAREGAARGGNVAPRARPRSLPRASLGVEGGVRLADRRAAEAARAHPATTSESASPSTRATCAPSIASSSRLYEKGYIYRDNYMVNWDVGSRSVISDLEVENREVRTRCTRSTIRSRDRTSVLTVATVRPETMLADTAVAVNPTDQRYGALIGRALRPAAGRTAPADHRRRARGSRVRDRGAEDHPGPRPDTTSRSGVRTASRRSIVIGEDGRMTEAAGERFAGLTVAEAQRGGGRRRFASRGCYEGEEPYVHSVPFSHRSGERIEPLISLQWFCRMDELAAPAIEVVERDRVRIAPEQHKRVYLEWMRNIRPWCISRQLWWGHRLPVWYCDACEETYVAESAPERCGACGGALRQDDDVLDTWFSSALWPFATLGWPDEDAPLLRRVLPNRRPGHGARHPLPLGRADGDDGDRVRRRRPLRRRLHHVDHPGARRAADVEVARHRHRPASTRSTSMGRTRSASGCWRCPRPRTCATPPIGSSRARTWRTSSGTPRG